MGFSSTSFTPAKARCASATIRGKSSFNMVWVALVYAVAGSVLTHVIGKPLIGLDFNQQRFEADFRFSLVRLRENSEGVALYRGEPEELAGYE